MFVKNNLHHVIIVIATVAFFFISPLIQQKLALRNSTLVIVSDPLPLVTQKARMYVDYLRLTNTSKKRV